MCLTIPPATTCCSRVGRFSAYDREAMDRCSGLRGDSTFGVHSIHESNEPTE